MKNLKSQTFFPFIIIIFSSGTLEIFCSKDIKIQGIIGPCTSLEKVVPTNSSLFNNFWMNSIECIV